MAAPSVARTRRSKVARVLREYKSGTLHSGSKRGPVVKSRKQAIAISLSEARKAGESVPDRKRRRPRGGARRGY